VLVAVLNPGLIPMQLDVVIGDHYFELEFEVEKRGFHGNGEEAEVEWPVEVEEFDGAGCVGGGWQAEVESSERMAKKQKRGEGSKDGEGWLRRLRGARMCLFRGRSRCRTCRGMSLRPF
jgi:hypothetical protein